MMGKFSFNDRPGLKVGFKVIVIVGILFFLYLFGNYFFLHWTSLNNLSKKLEKTTDQISQDLKYEDEKWNTDLYLSDIDIAYDNPLYIFTVEGFLIDRVNIINGFLDTSDFNYALSFETPRALTSSINESWRVYSKPIERNGKVEGAILVAFFDPEFVSTADVDRELIGGANQIDSKIELKNGKLDVSELKIKEVTFDVSFEVVDKFNRTLISVAGPPAYIDRSLIQKALKVNKKEIKDEKTGEPFLVLTKPIFDSNNSFIGIIAVGRSLQSINDILRNQILFSILSGSVVLLFMFIFFVYIFGRELKSILKRQFTESREPKPFLFKSFNFDPDESCIQIDGEKIKIPPDTNQYYLCKALLSSPKKKLEEGDLLEKLSGKDWGEADKKDKRKVYDSAKAINRKVKEKIGMELIIYKSRIYQINPEIASKIL